MLNAENFQKRQLSLPQAEAIANSCYDIGDKIKKNLIMALHGPKAEQIKEFSITADIIIEAKYHAYLELDPLTQTIVENILNEQDIGSAITNFDYLIKVFTNTKNALRVIEAEKESA